MIKNQEVTMDFNYIVSLIDEANKTRNETSITRRLLKVKEEIGEISEAYLGISGNNNYKNKTIDDLYEECVDTIIVLIDTAITPCPDCSYTASALIPIFFNDAYYNKEPINTEESIFNMSKNVIGAYEYISKKNYMSFHGSMSRAIQIATKLAYSLKPHEKFDEVLKMKLQKWYNTKPVEHKTFKEIKEQYEDR